MSYIGTINPLEINIKGELLQNRGLRISSTAIQHQGLWEPGVYTPGTVVSSTVLQNLTSSIPRCYQKMDAGQLDLAVYRNLLKIGSTICPALGNSRPQTFKPTYAGFGSWKRGAVDDFGNFVANPAAQFSLVDASYPPSEYPVNLAASYIYNDYNKLAWIGSWPARALWQKSTDDYTAILEPDSNSPKGDADEYFRFGFVSLVARQAYYEFWSSYTGRRINQYYEFVRFFQQAYYFMQTQNVNIAAFQNSKTFMHGNFSNINDLTTSDVSGVSLSLKVFGNDCIALGKSIDLSKIHKFGTPSVLLRTLQDFNAVTEALKLALLYQDLSASDISNLLEDSYSPAVEQEKKIYESFKLIKDDDLKEIKIILNCSTDNLETLADLLDPLKMFPQSYATLTIPEYSIDTASNKVYDFIYVGNEVNTRIKNWGDYLNGMLPDSLVIACGAFMMTMNQIKNINLMEFEKFAQVVSNLEATDKNLSLISTLGSSPVNFEAADRAAAKIALGSGNSGSYRFCDFLGCMSGTPYSDYFTQITKILQELATSELQAIYQKLEQKSLFNGWALISKGTGWQSTFWDPSYAYTIFKVAEPANQLDLSITVRANLTQILTAGTKIAFDNIGSQQYTVVSSSFNNNVTSIVLNPGLSSSVEANVPIYFLETTYNNEIQDLIDAANSEIARISTMANSSVQTLNYYWNAVGEQLAIEQRAITLAVPVTRNIYEDVSISDFDGFVSLIAECAMDTSYAGPATILQNICDTDTLGGQSLIAAIRCARNSQRLANTFGEVDTNISTELNPQQASAVISQTNSSGGITGITVTFSGYGYDETNPPDVIIGPYGGVFGGSGSGCTAKAVIHSGRVVAINITNPGKDYENPITVGKRSVYIDPPPRPARLGETTEPGSFAGSIYTDDDPIPDNLITAPTDSYSVSEAIDKVTDCNCDCWNS